MENGKWKMENGVLETALRLAQSPINEPWPSIFTSVILTRQAFDVLPQGSIKTEWTPSLSCLNWSNKPPLETVRLEMACWNRSQPPTLAWTPWIFQPTVENPPICFDLTRASYGTFQRITPHPSSVNNQSIRWISRHRQPLGRKNRVQPSENDPYTISSAISMSIYPHIFWNHNYLSIHFILVWNFSKKSMIRKSIKNRPSIRQIPTTI